MARWWVSWYEPSEDYRPVTWPLPPEVAGYWCSGHEWGGAQRATLCAVVDSESDVAARRVINAAWAHDGSIDWRFCDEQPADWMPPDDRFPHKGFV